MDPNTGAVQPASGGAPPNASPYNQMVSPPNMAMLNVNNLLNVKDSRWLQLEVCREFQRNKCTRPDTECKFAHPPPNVEVQNGRVTACYDSIKGRCNREKPPCKYFHPPQHLKDQLLINGRNHLALKNALMTQIHGLPPTTSVMPGTLQMQPTASPYLQGIPTMGGFGPYLASSSPVMTMGVNDAMSSQIAGVLPQQVLATQKLPRTDRLETFPGVVPYKRTATEKSGVPMFQPSNAAYQQALMQQLGTQTYVPVTCEYGGSQASAAAAAAAATNAVSAEGAPPRTTTASPTVTDISVSSTNTPTSNSSTISSSTSNSHNALVPVNSSKDGSALASSSQALSMPHPTYAVASSALNNLFPYPYKAVRPAMRGPTMLPPTAHPPPTMGLSPYAFSQPPPHQALGVSYVNSPVVSVAGMMPYGTQSPSFVHTGSSAAAAAAAAAASGMHGLTAASAAAAYSHSPAGVATGTTAVQHPAQFMYSSLPYPMSGFMMPQHSPAAFSTAASQYGSWAAAQAAAAAAAGTTEQPYKKLKTV